MRVEWKRSDSGAWQMAEIDPFCGNTISAWLVVDPSGIMNDYDREEATSVNY